MAGRCRSAVFYLQTHRYDGTITTITRGATAAAAAGRPDGTRPTRRVVVVVLLRRSNSITPVRCGGTRVPATF